MPASLLDRVLTSAASLTSRVGQFTPPSVTGDEVTIFIPGYKGSFLHTPTGESAWLSPEQVVTKGSRTLALPFEGQEATPRFDELQSGLPVTSLTLVPRLAALDFYLPWLKLGAQALHGFIAYGYDWRQDIRTTAQQLATFIEGLALERGGRLRVNIVGHSMGGLVALYMLRYGRGGERWSGATSVRRVVFAGVPFRGAPDIFDDLLLGTATGRNTALLSREALFTFPSAFQLLADDDDFFFDDSGRPVRVALSDVETWREQSWSVLAHPRWRDNVHYRRQLGDMMEARQSFHRELADLTDWPESLQALSIVGRGRPTIARFRWRGHVVIRDVQREDGDGSVLAAWAQPLPGVPGAIYETRAEHGVILNDREVQQRVLAFLESKHSEGTTLGFSGHMLQP